MDWFIAQIRELQLLLSTKKRLIRLVHEAEERRDTAERNAAAMRDALEYYNEWALRLNEALGYNPAASLWTRLYEALGSDAGREYVRKDVQDNENSRNTEGTNKRAP